MKAAALFALFATNSAIARPASKSRGSTYLPSTYVSPTFGQARANVIHQGDLSIQALTQLSDFPGGWVGENAYTAIAQWDQQQGAREFYDFVSQGETAYSTDPGGCYDYWQSPLVDCYNDDAIWAGLSSVQEYEAYGDSIFLERAESVWEVGRARLNRSLIDLS